MILKKTVAYACADIEVDNYRHNMLIYTIEYVAVLSGILFLMILWVIWYGRKHITKPIRAIVSCTRELDTIAPEKWLESDAWKNRILVQTNDELEELYNTVTQSEENVSNTVKKRLEAEQKLLQTEKIREMNHQLEESIREVEKANKAKTEFLSRVSHDMRTPLNGILGLTALMREDITDEGVLRDLSQLEMSGRYLLNLINDTLDVSRIESGNLILKPIVCDGKTVFRTCLDLLKPNMEEKKISLNAETDNLPFTILYVDAGRLEQVVMNIMGNAVKFTPEGGTIDFKMRNISVENGVITDEVVIRDTGIGMSKEFLEHIFEPYSQEDSGRTSVHQGTGLGMAITKQIIDVMGGEISVESEAGKGTTFRFTLPLQIATSKQVEEWKNSMRESDEGVSLQGRRVLLCEDHPLNTTIAIRLLEHKGIIVEHAANGKEGVEKFQNSEINYYDAILMDIRMPEMDGIEAAKTIRAMSREDAKTISIIAMTANAFATDIEETKEAGMNTHISKPIEPEVLYKALQQYIINEE